MPFDWLPSTPFHFAQDERWWGAALRMNGFWLPECEGVSVEDELGDGVDEGVGASVSEASACEDEAGVPVAGWRQVSQSPSGGSCESRA